MTNEESGYFAFPAIEFTDAHKGNTYVYVVSEVNDDPIGGFTYDTAIFKVYVSVEDNGDATLSATITKIEKAGTTVDEILFTNVYYAPPVDVELKGDKILTGKTMQDGEFQFRLEAVTANAPMPASATVSNNAKGGFTFGKITYEKAGVYVYTLSEINGGDARYDYDTSVYTVTVTVTDNSRGVLTARVELAKNDVVASGIVFRNGFVPTPISYDIYADFGGEKVLTGREQVAGEFEFVLINAINGQQIGQSVKNDGVGEFKFPAVQLSAPGVYHYKITEVLGDAKNVSYDTSSYHIRLEVVQDDSGVLSIADKQLYKGTVSKVEVSGVLTEVTTYENITANGTVKFNNTYTADPVYVTLEATKVLEGRNLVDGEFKFDLHKTGSTYAISNETLVQDDVVLVRQADGTGKIAFAEEKFDTVGTYYYGIAEDEVDENGITTHKTPYKVEITVTDGMNGGLVAAVKVDGQEVAGSTATVVQFKNSYSTTAGEIVIEGQKTLNGRDLVVGEFAFELYDENGLVETVYNEEGDIFKFAPIPATEAGEKVYTVKEVNGDAQGVSYDVSVFTVKVTVTDNLDGTLKVEYTYLKGDQSAEGIEFVNTYTAPEAPDKTGDEMNIGLWIGIMTVSGIGLVATAATGMKRKEFEVE